MYFNITATSRKCLQTRSLLRTLVIVLQLKRPDHGSNNAKSSRRKRRKVASGNNDFIPKLISHVLMCKLDYMAFYEKKEKRFLKI